LAGKIQFKFSRQKCWHLLFQRRWHWRRIKQLRGSHFGWHLQWWSLWSHISHIRKRDAQEHFGSWMDLWLWSVWPQSSLSYVYILFLMFFVCFNVIMKQGLKSCIYVISLPGVFVMTSMHALGALRYKLYICHIYNLSPFFIVFYVTLKTSSKQSLKIVYIIFRLIHWDLCCWFSTNGPRKAVMGTSDLRNIAQIAGQISHWGAYIYIFLWV